jgi:hypothetical protein
MAEAFRGHYLPAWTLEPALSALAKLAELELKVPGELSAPPAPAQWFRHRGLEPARGYKRLFAAVLLNAIVTAGGKTPQADEARRWLAEPDADTVVNLRDCAEALGVELDWVQKGAAIAQGRGPGSVRRPLPTGKHYRAISVSSRPGRDASGPPISASIRRSTDQICSDSERSFETSAATSCVTSP